MQRWCDDLTQTVAVAEIGLVEIAAAFAGKLRGEDSHRQNTVTLAPTWQPTPRDEYVLATINRAVVDEAIELTSQHRLRGYDAVHRVCALTLNRAFAAHQLAPLVLYLCG